MVEVSLAHLPKAGDVSLWLAEQLAGAATQRAQTTSRTPPAAAPQHSSARASGLRTSELTATGSLIDSVMLTKQHLQSKVEDTPPQL